MITPPRREIREDPTEGELAGEESRSVPYQGDADQLPALARSLVDRLLQGSLRSTGLAGVQRSMLRVVALGFRTGGGIPLSLGHVLPPFFLLPLGQTVPHKHDATNRNHAHLPEVNRTIAELLLQCYGPLSWRSEVNRLKAPSKCTKKAAVLDCAHFQLERGKGSKSAEYQGVKAGFVNTLTAAWGKPVERGFRASPTGAESIFGKGERVAKDPDDGRRERPRG